jgi:hypothetical protein
MKAEGLTDADIDHDAEIPRGCWADVRGARAHYTVARAAPRRSVEERFSFAMIRVGLKIQLTQRADALTRA